MEGANDTGEPSFNGGEDCCGVGVNYALGFYFIFLLFVFTLCYTSYICNRTIRSQISSPTTTSDGGDDDYHIIRLPPQGLCDDVLSTFPTFLYSDVMIPGSACSICLADYKPPDVLRLLPECSHLFHSSCIDTWLKMHPTCPVCRNSFDFSN
ncbi:hypothetical protein LXL04_012802 [Taraxacum kok-saghyz]